MRLRPQSMGKSRLICENGLVVGLEVPVAYTRPDLGIGRYIPRVSVGSVKTMVACLVEMVLGTSYPLTAHRFYAPPSQRKNESEHYRRKYMTRTDIDSFMFTADFWTKGGLSHG